jgi:hypothetical protein
MSSIKDEFLKVENLYKKALELNEQLEDNEIECDDSEACNFPDYEERFEVLKSIYEDWINGKVKKLSDIDMAALSGVEDDSELDFESDDEIKDEFISGYLSDFKHYFQESIKAFEECLENSLG